MRAVPPETPVTTPVDALTIAIELSPLLHTPFRLVSDNVILVKGHKDPEPVIAPGGGVTVTVRVARQPDEGSVYEIIVVPRAAPETMPTALIGAATALLLLQVPVDGVSVR